MMRAKASNRLGERIDFSAVPELIEHKTVARSPRRPPVFLRKDRPLPFHQQSQCQRISQSVHFIMTHVEFGWLIQPIHTEAVTWKEPGGSYERHDGLSRCCPGNAPRAPK